MRDDSAGETPLGTPGQRALGAIGSAVRRAQETHAGVVLPTEPSGTKIPKLAAEGREPVNQNERSQRRLLVAIVTVSVFIAVGLILLVSLPNDSPPSRQASTGSHRTSGKAGTSPRPPAGAAPGTTTTTVTTSTPAAVIPAGPPVIASIDPVTGSAGQSVQVNGTNFLSSNGRIVAMFNGDVVPTDCPTQNVCNVTVPPDMGATSVRLTIKTASGTSNATTFTYSR
jgi:hypothetical protein